MAQFLNLLQELDRINEGELNAQISGDILNDFLFEYVQNLEEVNFFPDEIDIYVTEEEDTLFQMLADLQNITLTLLKQKYKLLDLKQKILIEKLSHFSDIIQKAVKKFRKLVNNTEACTVFEEYLVSKRIIKQKFLKDTKEKLADDIESIAVDTHIIFSKFQQMFTKFESAIRHMLRNSESRLNISNMPRIYQEDLCILLSVLKEHSISLSYTHKSSKNAFHKFQSLVKYDVFNSNPVLYDKIILLINAVDLAELSYRKLSSIFFDVLNLHCATTALY